MGHPAGTRPAPATAKQLQSIPAMKTEMRQILQAMSLAQKLRAAERLYYSARQLKAAALRAEHPDWTDEQVRQAVREIFLYARS
jgi:Rv0078B-related antitoxin